VDPKQAEIEADKLRKLRAQRNQPSWRNSLDSLDRVTRAGENVFPAILSAVKARATVGEICDVWRMIFGEYRPRDFI
jgi:methylmalonyl-CoA mutase N-terminal domain/subunit